jgi:DNA-binding NarL/FixJ family response regulator
MDQDVQFVSKPDRSTEPIVMIETTLQNNQLVPVALVSRPGIMQQSLRSSLASCQGIAVVASCGNGLTALHQVTKLRPALLVIDSNLLDEEVEALIAAVKVEQPTIGCLVVVRSSHQERQMLALGADAVVLRDAPPQQLHEALARLARRREILRPEQRLCDEQG